MRLSLAAPVFMGRACLQIKLVENYGSGLQHETVGVALNSRLRILPAATKQLQPAL